MNKLKAYIGLFMAVSIWSFSFISIDITLETMTASEINMLRLTIASILLWFIHMLRGKTMLFKRKDLPLIAISGVFGTAGYYFFENISLYYVNPVMVSVITGAIPMMTLVIAMIFMGKRTRFRNIFMIGVSFVGVLILSDPISIDGVSNLRGFALVLAGNLCWVIYTLFNERLNHVYDKLNLLTIQVFFGTIIFYLMYLLEMKMGYVKMMDIRQVFTNGPLIGHLVFLSVMSSILAYYLYNYALVNVGVTLSALFINVIPVVTLLIGVGIGQASLSFEKIIGCLLVVLAVYMIEDI